MVDTILVPLDGSARSAGVLPLASVLARQLGCPLHLVHVRSDPQAPEVVVGELTAAADLDAADLDVAELHQRSGAAGKVILELASELPRSTVCMRTRARGDVTQPLLGSTAGHVVRHSHRPTLLLGPSAVPNPSPHTTRVVAAVDGSDNSEAILPVAAEWAQRLDVPLRLIHVAYPPQGAPPGELQLPPPIEEMFDYLPRKADELSRHGLDTDWEVLSGVDTAAVLAEQVTRHPDWLLAMATHGRTGLGRILVGSVTTDTVHRCPGAVLTLRPPQLRPRE